MKTVQSFAAAMIGASALVAPVTAQQPGAAAGTIVEKAPRVVAGREVRNFDQIKVGDELVVTHAEALALELKKGGDGIRERVESQGAARAPVGTRPGMAEVNRVSVLASVVAVNARTQTVTLRGVEHTVDLRVADRNQFKLIKVGDQVQVTYTDAVAISMEPPGTK